MPDATAADWAAISSHAEVRTIDEGLALVQAGEHDRALYLLTEGTVGVRLPRDEGAFKTIDAPSVPRDLASFAAQPPARPRRSRVPRPPAALADARPGPRRRGPPPRRRRLRPPARARAGAGP